MTVVDQLSEKIRQHAVDLVRRAADICVASTQAAASERTGALREGISHDEPQLNDPYVTCTITSAAEYSAAQDTGSGIYGPSGQRIYPSKPGGVLAFDWAAAGGLVFFKSVAGSPGRHFFSEPMAERWATSVLNASGPT